MRALMMHLCGVARLGKDTDVADGRVTIPALLGTCPASRPLADFAMGEGRCCDHALLKGTACGEF